MLASALPVKLFVRRLIGDSVMIEHTETVTDNVDVGEYVTTWHYSPGGMWHEYRNGNIRYIVRADLVNKVVS